MNTRVSMDPMSRLEKTQRLTLLASEIVEAVLGDDRRQN